MNELHRYNMCVCETCWHTRPEWCVEDDCACCKDST